MHEYDVALKRMLTRPGSLVLTLLTGFAAIRWLNVELPRVNNRRVDLLGIQQNGQLIHIEFQSRNEKDLALRMAEYMFGIWRQHGQLPIQIVLYVGERPLRMKGSITAPGLAYEFHLIDVRQMDAAIP